VVSFSAKEAREPGERGPVFFIIFIVFFTLGFSMSQHHLVSLVYTVRHY
jgi:hypothetical protein